ncbi:tetratricopeptide repeat protein [Photobacterium aphoticum]|uniref:tetratricopeptide repeat protein n=1 Tax=Photobacterium aphoticum TaxID=754436 RepID=UPI00069D3AE4|nr:tetratricopeptide repeat protein [Photobacterium aphoticum]PSU57380.1 hypothetical protein C9I90_09615 [Photobacterium aphoticum]GHA63736.1 hypothetical protein GCM10007086_42090 [Photobacterium aphoticum]
MNKSTLLSAIVLACALTGCATSGNTANSVAEMAKVNNYPGMIAYYKAALQQQPGDAAIMQKLADVYYQSGDLESAGFYVDHLQAQGEATPALLVLAGHIDDAKGDFTGALSAFEQAAKQGDNSAALNISQGIVLGKLGRFADAEDQFNQARLKGFDDIAIKNNLAVLYLAQGQFQRVVEMLMPVYTQADFNVKDHQTLAVNLAIALIKLGDDKQAYGILKGMYNDEQLAVLFRQVKNMTVLPAQQTVLPAQGDHHDAP